MSTNSIDVTEIGPKLYPGPTMANNTNIHLTFSNQDNAIMGRQLAIVLGGCPIIYFHEPPNHEQ